MKKLFVILFAFAFLTPLMAQQLNYTFGYTTTGVQETDGVIVDYDTTGATDYSIVIPLDDWYPYEVNPAVYDSATALGSSDRMVIGTLWYKFDLPAATDSCSFDIDAYPGLYGDGNRTIAGATWGAALEQVNDASNKDDVTGAVNIYVLSSGGKHLPPHLIKLVFDLDTSANRGNGADIYYEFVYTGIYQSAKERKRTEYEGQLDDF